METIMLDKILKSMGYRRMNKPSKQVWGKPVGCSLFTIEVTSESLVFTNWFKGANNKILIWDSSKIKPSATPEEVLSWLKQAESYTRISDVPAEFDFLSLEDMLDL